MRHFIKRKAFGNIFSDDGSLLAITNRGSIREHFMFDEKSTQEEGITAGDSVVRTPYSFTFADDEIENVHRSISKNMG